MKVLIAGATGFIGSHIAERLCTKSDIELLSVKRSTSDIWRCKSFSDKINWIDIDSDSFEDEVKKFSPQIVINSAWDGVEADLRLDWMRQIGNLAYQQRLLDISKSVGANRFISIGSQAEYGVVDTCIKESCRLNPTTPYGAVKVAASEIMRSFCTINNIEWYWFRLFSTFGQREGRKWLIPSVIKQIEKNRCVHTTKGEQRYSYLYVGEVAKIIEATLTTTEKSGFYNISSATPIPIKDLILFIRDKIDKSAEIIQDIPYREDQPMLIQGSTDKTDKIYKTDSSGFADMLERTINYYTKR